MVGSNIDYGQQETIVEEDLPAFIRDASDKEEISDTPAYNLADIYFTGTDGFVKWTTAITKLKPGRQTRGHNHPDKDEYMDVRQGNCLITIDNTQFNLKVGNFVLIERGKHHKLFNTSNTEECHVIHHFPGHLIRPGFVRKH